MRAQTMYPSHTRGKDHRSSKRCEQYFTEFTARKGVVYILAGTFVAASSVVAILQPYIALPCTDTLKDSPFENPAYDANPCNQMRFPCLLWLTVEECAFGRRLLASVLLGGVIGWERREADRPAGIRTMSLVSLGSCLFTINSTMAFLKGPMNWDASRVSAAIPSGVGFLGAGLIFKKDETNEEGERTHVVHGLTTAASVWLSAAVGIACGGDLYFAAAFCTAVMMLLLRFGPRSLDHDNEEEEEEEEDYEPGESDDEVSLLQPTYDSVAGTTPQKTSVSTSSVPGETDRMIRGSASKRHMSERSGSTSGNHRLRRSRRSNAALATAV
mmetsp:Transcript_28276/g.62985  ORF Transcript_28276/g.62985 Transcript_28276/m.62985 type:complete len:328 (-) Transcript_28276:199-1182(-)